MFDVNQITAADQQIWAESGLSADQTSTSNINYDGAKSLTLEEGKALLNTFESNGAVRAFARFAVKLDNGVGGKESARQLFRAVYATVPAGVEVKDFSINRSNGTVTTIKGFERPEGTVLLRRFPSLSHEINGQVPYKSKAQTIKIQHLDKVGVLTYDTNGNPFMRIVENYAVEA